MEASDDLELNLRNIVIATKGKISRASVSL